ncbi:MAG: PDDEXK nuclease domain-containing protein [Firmicutes bacterium]|nr:PDDEXK nuclease domain-containing protein [Bacillota bacterium]
MANKKGLTPQNETPNELLSDLVGIIEEQKKTIYHQVNSGVVMTFWKVGKRINDEILGNERAEYGKQISATVSHQLQAIYGNSYEHSNLTRMIKFAREFPIAEIAVTLSQQLSWSHILALLPLKTIEAKIYYAEESAKRNLGVRDLRHLIARKGYERRDIANLALPSQSKIPFNVFKDPYLLDAFNLKENFLEADLEKAIVAELEKFILEFGSGFCFVGRQKRIIYKGEEYYIDLLFYNRDLRRLVAIELKLEKFRLEHKGQMEGYLRILNETERKSGEEEPIGIILCTEANRDMVELLEMDKSGIAVSEFWTKVPPKEQFASKLQEIVEEAKERLARREQKGNSPNLKQIQYFIEPKPDDYPDKD